MKSVISQSIGHQYPSAAENCLITMVTSNVTLVVPQYFGVASARSSREARGNNHNIVSVDLDGARGQSYTKVPVVATSCDQQIEL